MRRILVEPLLYDVSQEVHGPYSALHGVQPGWKMLDRLQITLAYRITSRVDDQALCLASICGLDPASCVGIPLEDGIFKSFGEMEDIPLELLFLGKLKLNLTNYRLIPQTILWRSSPQALPGLGVSCKQASQGIHAILPAIELDIALLPESHNSHAIKLDRNGYDT